MEKSFSEKSLIFRLRVLLVLTVSFVATFFIILSYRSNIENFRLAVSNKLEAVTKSLTQNIKGEDHLAITEKYKVKDAITSVDQDPTYHKIQVLLKKIKDANNIKSAIYTMVIDSSTMENNRPVFRFVVASSENPFYHHTFSTYPDEELEKFYQGAVLPPYEDENGTWISAFSPIRTEKGDVVAIVQSDIEFDEYISEARLNSLKQLAIMPLIIILVFVVSSRFLKRIITREDMVTQLKESLIVAKEARVKAEDALRSQEIFLAKVSHEMRTPLNGIIGITSLLDKTKLSIEEQKNLDLVVNSGRGLLVIINDLLDVSKINSGNLDLEVQPFDLQHSTKSAAMLLKQGIEDKGIEFKVEVDDLEGNVLGDDLRYRQVITNLLSNAAKFTPEEGVIQLYAKKISENKDQCSFKIGVRDSGIGIAKEKQAHIFEQFKQEDDGTTRDFGGTGLGLSICKRLVELSGGELKLESEKGAGAHFYFEVTLGRTDKERVSRNNSGDLTIDLTGKRVLAVDDNEVNRKISSNVVAKKGAEVDLAENGKEAVELAKKNKYDVILMDIQMPVMGGDEATRIIKGELGFNVPVIALTANAIDGDREKYMKMGFDDYLSKPFHPSDLFQKLGGFLNLSVSKVEQVTHQVKAEPIDEAGSLYDLSMLEMLADGDDEFKIDLLQTFTGQVDSSVERIYNFLKAKDYEQLAKAAHKFNSSVDSVGIKNGKKMLKEIELECKKEDRDLAFIESSIKTICDITIKVKADIESKHLGVAKEETDDVANLYDLSMLEMLADGDEEFKIDLLQTFVGQVDPSVERIYNFLKEEEYEKLAKAAHKFNSSVDSVGIKNGKKMLKDIELECKKESPDLDFIKSSIKTICDITVKVKTDIETKYLNN